MRTKNTDQEVIKVPLDMAMDIISIVVKERLKHDIIQVVESRGLIVIALYFDKGFTKQQSIMQNIKSLLDEYDEFRWSQNEQLNWRES